MSCVRGSTYEFRRPLDLQQVVDLLPSGHFSHLLLCIMEKKNPFFSEQILKNKNQPVPPFHRLLWIFNCIKERGGKKGVIRLSLLNDSLMPNTILTLMYNIFKVREEETLYKPRSVQSSGLGYDVSRINGKYKNKPTGYKWCKDCPNWFCDEHSIWKEIWMG